MATKPRLLEITSCLKCPHHEKVSDPGSDDSFDAMDEAVLCKLTEPCKLPDRTFPHRPIIRCERSTRAFEAMEIPDWCPLPIKKGKR